MTNKTDCRKPEVDVGLELVDSLKCHWKAPGRWGWGCGMGMKILGETLKNKEVVKWNDFFV